MGYLTHREDEAVEDIHDALNEADKLTEECLDRFTYRNPRLIERYLNGDCEILIKGGIKRGREDFIAVLRASIGGSQRQGEGGHGDPKEIGEQSLHLGHNIEINRMNLWDDHREKPVLVAIVKLAEEPQQVVPTTVWLEPLHYAYGRRRGSVYISANQSVEIIAAPVDREPGLYLSGVASAALPDEIPCQMIQRDAAVVDAVCNDEWHVVRNVMKMLDSIDAKAALLVALGCNGIWLGVTESLDKMVHFTETIFGPVDLSAATGEHLPPRPLGHGIGVGGRF